MPNRTIYYKHRCKILLTNKITLKEEIYTSTKRKEKKRTYKQITHLNGIQQNANALTIHI